MNYDEFKQFVTDNVSQFLSDENQIEEIEEKQIYKNHVTLDALIVKFANINISPTIYMNNFLKIIYQRVRLLKLQRGLQRLLNRICLCNHWKQDGYLILIL